MMNEKYKIYYRQFDENKNVIGEGVYHKEYVYPGNALREARQRYGDRSKFEFSIAPRNPFIEYFKDVTCSICGKTHTIEESVNGLDFDTSIYISTLECGKRSRSLRNVCSDCYDKVVDFINTLMPNKE